MSIVTHLWTYLSLFDVVFGVERPFWILNGTLMLNGILVLNGLLAAGQASRSRRPPGVLRRVRAFPRLAVQAVILMQPLEGVDLEGHAVARRSPRGVDYHAKEVVSRNAHVTPASWHSA